PAVANVRQAEPSHAQQAADVRLDHRRLVLVGRLPERVAPEPEACVVDEDVDPAEVGDGALDEALGALAVGHVQVERVETVPVREQLDTAGADGHPRARIGESVRSGCPDPARGAGDDSRLVLERGHERGTLTRMRYWKRPSRSAVATACVRVRALSLSH